MRTLLQWVKSAALVAALVGSACGAAPADAQEPEDNRPAKGIQDNSFLIEEAYNQEPGVVQHITTLRRQDRDWFLNFTQEWPIGTQAHQFSYTLPYSFLRLEDEVGGRYRASGLGDVQLNYRFQALEETAFLPAFAPRLSVILPTGNSRRGLGSGSAGIQTNMPFSKIVSDRVTLHANAGLTSLFDLAGRSPTSLFAGGSAVYAVTRDFNVLFEAVAERNEEVGPNREIERERSLTLSPGARYAFNLKAGQLVVGAAAPVRLTKQDKPDYGVFLYLSFEHSIAR